MPPKKKKATPSESTSVPVESLTHSTDTRTNIPTRETAEFATSEAASPRKVLYPRDSSLDPQLVWKGKDEQDAKPFEVPAPPIYVQEKIHPRFIIDDLKARVNANKPKVVDLFSDFNGLDDFQKKLDFYQHDQHWTNRLILGDSLLVMNSLAERERLRGRVQCIYFDPPYGIKFGSNWQVSTRKRDVKDAKAEDLTRQPEQIKAFRDTWELGIHSYLTYLRDRLTIARDLLTESGSIFVQIGDENVHLVRCLLDEVFGSENCCQIIPFRKKLMPLGAKLLEGMCDFVLWYGKDKPSVKFRHLYKRSVPSYESRWTNIELLGGERRKLTKAESENLSSIQGKVYQLVSQRKPEYFPQNDYEFIFKGKTIRPPKNGCWMLTKDKMMTVMHADRLEIEGDNLSYVYYHEDFPLSKYTNFWEDTSPVQDKSYVVQTSTKVIERCMLMTTDPGDLVLDPTCGSGTTAYVAE